MAGSVNKVILIGNLGRDPEIRRTQDGRPIANLNIATTETWRDKASGEKKEKTEWHRVVIFNENLCKVAEQYLKKGAKVYIEGALQTRKWQDQSGAEKFTTEIVLQNFNGTLTMLEGRAGAGGMQESGQSDYGSGGGDYGGGPSGGSSGGGSGSGGGSSGGGSGSGGSGSGGYSAAKSAPKGNTGHSGGGKPSFDKALDDEIPF